MPCYPCMYTHTLSQLPKPSRSHRHPMWFRNIKRKGQNLSLPLSSFFHSSFKYIYISFNVRWILLFSSFCPYWLMYYCMRTIHIYISIAVLIIILAHCTFSLSLYTSLYIYINTSHEQWHVNISLHFWTICCAWTASYKFIVSCRKNK